MNKPSKAEFKQLTILTQKFHLPMTNIHKLARQVAPLLSPSPKVIDLLRMFEKLDELGSPVDTAQEVAASFPQYQTREVSIQAPTRRARSTRKQTPGFQETGEPYFVELAEALGPGVTIAEAEQFFKDVKHVLLVAKRCGRNTILKAVKYCRNAHGTVTMDALELELRRRRYGYKRDPDAIRIIPIPMGGKNSR